MKYLFLLFAVVTAFAGKAQLKHCDTSAWQTVEIVPPYSSQMGWAYSIPEIEDQSRTADSVSVTKVQYRFEPRSGTKQMRYIHLVLFLPEVRRTYYDQMIDSIEKR